MLTAPAETAAMVAKAGPFAASMFGKEPPANLEQGVTDAFAFRQIEDWAGYTDEGDRAELRDLPRVEGHREGSASVREVTRCAGLEPNAFYRHFKDFDDLGLAQPILRAVREEIEAIAPAIADTSSGSTSTPVSPSITTSGTHAKPGQLRSARLA